jgi:hypothetical protein
MLFVCDIRLYLTPLGQAKQFEEEGNWFTPGVICYFTQAAKKHILIAQYKRISNEQAV